MPPAVDLARGRIDLAVIENGFLCGGGQRVHEFLHPHCGGTPLIPPRRRDFVPRPPSPSLGPSSLRLFLRTCQSGRFVALNARRCRAVQAGRVRPPSVSYQIHLNPDDGHDNAGDDER